MTGPDVVLVSCLCFVVGLIVMAFARWVYTRSDPLAVRLEIAERELWRLKMVLEDEWAQQAREKSKDE